MTAQATPEGKITSLHYSAFLRKYDWGVEETKDGLKVHVGAQSEVDQVATLLGAVVGAVGTLAGKGVVQ